MGFIPCICVASVLHNSTRTLVQDISFVPPTVLQGKTNVIERHCMPIIVRLGTRRRPELRTSIIAHIAADKYPNGHTHTCLIAGEIPARSSDKHKLFTKQVAGLRLAPRHKHLLLHEYTLSNPHVRQTSPESLSICTCLHWPVVDHARRGRNTTTYNPIGCTF
jgi:hypothetical protein